MIKKKKTQKGEQIRLVYKKEEKTKTTDRKQKQRKNRNKIKKKHRKE